MPLHGGPNGREVAIEHGPEQLGIEAPELPVGVDDARDEHGHDLARGPRRRRRQLDRLPCALDAGRRAERLVLSEDRLLELPELVGGIDPELLDEHPPDVLVRLERLGLPAAAVQREHQLRAGPLPVRLGRDERLEVGDNVEVPPERELRVDELLPRRELQLLEPRDLRARERLERQIGERRPAEERQRIPQLLGALGRWSVSALHDLPLEAHGVDLLGREVERIAGGQRRNRLAAELLSQLRHVVLERVGRSAGRLLPPEVLDESVLGNRPPDPQRECREQGARFLAVRGQDLLAVDDVELTEQSDLEHAAFYHGRRIPGGTACRRCPLPPSCARDANARSRAVHRRARLARRRSCGRRPPCVDGVQREDRVRRRARRRLRHLRDEPRRERPAAPHDRGPDRHRAVVVSGRESDRLHEQPRRERRDLRDAGGRDGPDAADDERRHRPDADVVAGRPRPRVHERARRQRGHLRDERGRERTAASDHRPAPGRQPGVVAGWGADRLPEHPRRQRGDLRDERRRRRADAADERSRRRRQPVVGAGRKDDRVRVEPRRELRDLHDERGRERTDSAHAEPRHRCRPGLVPERLAHRVHVQPRRQLRDLLDERGRQRRDTPDDERRRGHDARLAATGGAAAAGGRGQAGSVPRRLEGERLPRGTRGHRESQPCGGADTGAAPGSPRLAEHDAAAARGAVPAVDPAPARTAPGHVPARHRRHREPGREDESAEGRRPPRAPGGRRVEGVGERRARWSAGDQVPAHDVPRRCALPLRRPSPGPGES